MRNNKNKGFTLVELLVVIAILAILATVSVVGYTSFIKSAHISNDENIAAQLNQFLAAYQADHTTEHYGKPITEDNIWEITQTILKDSQLEELEPHAKDYGYHYYFKFDGQGGGQYVAADENTLRISAFTRVVRFFVSADTPKSNYAGVFYDEAGDKYFLCDTKGSPIAEAIKGFHTFKDIDGATTAEQFANFKTLVNGLNEELYGSLKTLAASGVFVTKEGNFAFDRNAEHSNLFFHEDATYVGNVIKDTAGEKPLGETDYLLTINEDTTLTIPAGVKLPANSLNISVADGKNVTVKLDASAWTNELKDIVDAYFTNDNVTVVVGDKEYKINGNYIYDATKYNPAAPADHVDTLKFNNPLYSFEIGIVDKDDNALNNTTVTVDEETVRIGYAAWDKGSFKLEMLNLKGKSDESDISNLDVVWSSSNPGYLSIDDSTGEVIATFSGTHDPSIEYVTITATAKVSKQGYLNDTSDEATFASAEYKIYVGGVTDNTVNIANKDNWNYDESNHTYYVTLPLTQAAGTDYVLVNTKDTINTSGITIADTIEYACANTAVANVYTDVNGNTYIKALAEGTTNITVTVGSYSAYNYTINVTVADYTKDLPLQYKYDSNILYVGSSNAIKISDLFEFNDGVTKIPENTRVLVFSNTMSLETDYMNPQDRGCLPATATTSGAYVNDSGYTYGNLDYKYDLANGKAITTLNDELQLGGSTTSKITIALFSNGVRISEDVQVQVVEGYNVRQYSDMFTGTSTSAKGNIVFLPEEDENGNFVIKMSANGKMTIPTNKTLYGNTFTFDITNGITSGNEGIITLSGHMRDTRVIGSIYDTIGMQADNPYGTNAVKANGGSTITNCYIANCRAPLRTNGAVTVTDTVLFGGRYCNIDITGGTLTLKGTVITVNQPHHEDSTKTKVVGTGINVWWSADNSTTAIDASDCNLHQYNFVASTDTGLLKPATITFDNRSAFQTLGIAGKTISFDLANMFTKIFTDTKHKWTDELKYEDYHFTKTGSTTKYVNASVVSLNMSNPSFSYKTTDSTYGDTEYWVGTGIYVIVEITYPIKITALTNVENNLDDFNAGVVNGDAVEIYKYWDANGKYGGYDFSNGLIIPQ